MSAQVRIEPATEATIRDFANVMVEAFSTEGTNAYLFDFSKRSAWRARVRAALVEARLFHENRNHVLVAIEDEQVVGGAILAVNRGRPVLKRAIQTLRWIVSGVPLITAVRWRRVPGVMKAVNLPRKPDRPYYTLAAVAVHPAQQGKGIGRLILDEIHRICDEDLGCTGVYLYTADTKNRVMYERCGYRCVAERSSGTLTMHHMFRPHPANEFTLGTDDPSI